MTSPETPIESLAARLRDLYPELDAVREAAAEPVYLVGGAVRDLLLGRGRADLDVVVEGDAAALAERLGGALDVHDRFGTATVELDGHRIDIAAARSETYPQPGALPVVVPDAEIEADLARRDFSVNAMALPLDGEARLIDPHRGRADLGRGELRVLHPASFADDPTRAIRAARYASRFGFRLEPETERLILSADLGAVSADRRRSELLRLAAEPLAPRGFELLVEWGLVEPRQRGVELAAAVGVLLAREPWHSLAAHDQAVLAAALGPAAGEGELAAAAPERPSAAVELARGHSPVELVLARAMGAEWLDRCLAEWIPLRLEIDGEDLIAAGIEPGPALGRGLEAALRAKLDGEVSGRDEELASALVAARRP